MQPEAPTYKYVEWRIRFLRARAVAAMTSLNFERAAELEAEADREEAKLRRQRVEGN